MPVNNFLEGGGEMGELTRSYNWSGTIIGKPEYWPQSLKTTLSIILNSRFPMFLWWGTELICFYNDAYRPSLGEHGKHPSILGMPAVKAWPEIWETIKPLIDQVLAGEGSVWSEDQLIPIYRNGHIEDVYWTFGYSPVIDESGKISGVLVTCTETTGKVFAYQKLEENNEQLRSAVESEIRARKEIEESEERFRTMAEGSDILISVADETGNVTYFSKAWIELTGRPADSLLKFGWLDLVHPEDRESYLSIYLSAFKKQEAFTGEFRVLSKDGDYRWLLAKGPPRFRQDGSFAGCISSCIDITERKQNEIQLTESAEKQSRLAAIINTSDDTILSKTLQGIITSWNKAAERMFGYTEAEVLGKHISLIIPPSRLKEEEFIISQIIRGNKVNHFETIRIAKNGREIPLSLSVSPITDSEGNIIGASKIARDVTAQQAEQKATRRYTERLEIMNLIVETISEELDLNKILQKVTDATTTLTGAEFGAFFYNTIDETGESFMSYSLSGALKETFEKFDMPWNTAIFYSAFFSEGVVRVDDITQDSHYGKNYRHYGMLKGDLPMVSYLAVPVISRSGTIIGGLFFGHPESARFTEDHESLVVSIAAQAAVGIDNAKLYEEIKLLNEKKDEFIGLASHELKTPLTSINGYLQILNRINTDEKSRKFLDKAVQQVKKLTTLVNDLLDVSKIEAGKLQLTREEFDIRKVLDDVIELIGYSTEKYKILFETNVETCKIHADSQRIEQVLINLLTNAIKYSPGSDKIEVSLIRSNSEVKIGVKDFGAGIAEDKLGQIFNRFYRIEDANPNIGGLGIGLYLANEIITRHDGKLWVESKTGYGSTFFFVIPTGQAGDTQA